MALFDNGGDEGGKLWLLPAVGIAELSMDEVEAFERMVLFNSAVHVDATVFASLGRTR